MPRIDPIRLLSCLKPLLNLQTGGIKSDKEVDKVFVLMTKFSKKLVSKCTYINILKASPSDVLNLFMERGGWEMLYNWVVEAKTNKNNVLLNEILSLFLVTPASVERLRTNSLPKEVKQISIKWDDEDTKSFAEKVVAFWINIARNEDSSRQANVISATGSSVQVQNPNTGCVNQTAITGGTSFDMQNLGQLSDESAINSNLTDSIIYESENPQNLDMDVGNIDLNEIMDFNPDLFTKTIDMHLSDLNTNESDRTVLIANNNVNSDSNVAQQHPMHILANTTQSVPNDYNAVPIVTTVASRTVPRIVIKTSGGQRSVVAATADGTQLTPAQPIPNAKERLCYVTHNGQRFLMSLRVADNEEVSKIKATPTVETAPSEPEVTQDQQVSSSVSSCVETTPAPVSDTKRKRPRKDPTITAAKTNAAMQVASVDTPDHPKVLKTYSKKTNAELVISKGAGDNNAVNVPESKESSKPKPNAVSVLNANSSASAASKSPNTSSSSSAKRSTSKSRGSSSKSAAAAAAQAKAEKDLMQKVKEQRKKVKERMEAAKNQDKKKDDDKQKQKDDQTLKEIYGASSVNASKIPKKPKPSFTDLIGVPGASEDTKKEKITKEKNQDGDKGGKSKKDDSEASLSPTAPREDELKDVTGFGAYSRPETKEIGPAKERRHVKVYTSSKSKNMDLLETMTKGSTKGKPKLDLETGKTEGKPIDKGNAVSFEDAISGGGAAIKPAKRPSIDSGKSGDSKKLKLDDSIKDKKDSKDKSKDKKDDAKKSKDKSPTDKSKKPQVIQESSLFMDAINNISREPSKIKRKRRISSNSENKEKEITGSSTNHYDDTASNKVSPNEDVSEKIVKPVFNFYRDTLNDEDEPPVTEEPTVGATPSDNNEDDVVLVEPIAEPNLDVDDIRDDFAPVEGEGRLKSCLCLHRPKGKPKKSIRWRDEDELKEFHYFEMDETERVNVTKQGNQVNRNFSEMRLMEKSEEKLLIRRKYVGETPPVEKFEWMKLRKIDPEQLASQPELKVSSREKQVQEERERSILEVFYFPGTMLPENPSEEYVVNLETDRSHAPRIIPSEDIPVLTKVSDYRSTPWPAPRIAKPFTENKSFSTPKTVKLDPVGNMVPNPMVNVDPTNAFANPYNVANNAGSFDLFNPWSQSFDPHPQSSDPWKAAQDVQNFGAFPAVQPNAVPPAVNSFQSMPFGYPFPPPPQIGTAPVPMGQIPGQLPPPGNFSGFSAPMPNQFDLNPHQIPRDDGPPHHGNRHPSGRPNRDMDYRDVARRDRDHDRDIRNRDSRPGAARDRERDRDREGRDRGRDRERYEKDRDYRTNHDRRRPGGRRSTLCNYFAKGFCREGNKCSFLHPGVNGPPTTEGPNHTSNNNFPRHKPSPPPANNRYDDRRRTSPPASHHRGLPNDLHNSPSSSAALSSSGSSGSGAPKEIPGIESPTPETETRFIMPPSSPNEHQSFPLGGEAVKVIPTYTEEDWG